MEQTYNSQYRKIEDVVKCPKDLSCYKTNHIGSDNLLECLSENPQKSVFSSCHMHRYLCKCPVRIYIAEHFRMQEK